MAFFLEYLKSQKITTHKNASAIIEEYGKELGESIKKGYRYTSLLGSIFIVKKQVLSKTPKVLSGATKRLRDATGDNTLKVYRTNDYYYSIYWTMQIVYRTVGIRLTKFQNRSLKDYEDYLDLDSPSVELERSKTRTSQYQLKK